MRKRRMVVRVLLVAASLIVATGALAIGNGTPDGNGHPNVGMLAAEIDGDVFPVCSGSYAGAQKGVPGSGVFLTAGHCVAWMPEAGIAGSQLRVTFDTTATVDPATGEVVGATTWYPATAFAFDPAFGHDRGNLKDYAVVLLGTTVPVTPVNLPTAGLLDAMAAKGGLRPGAAFDNVGYGVVPSFKKGRPRFEPPPGRMFSTSFFQGLTKSWLKLLMNSDARGGTNGGVCFGDSGSPKLVRGTNTAVAVTTGGDPNCRAESYNQRLDVADARAFLGLYLNLP
jgi:hypothetical protein